MIKAKSLKNEKFINHGFFGRNGGFSKGIYEGLNCGLGSKDNRKNVNKNLKFVSELFGCKRKSLFFLHQVHSNKLHQINKKDIVRKLKKRVGDALITSQKGIALAILTADCAPVMIIDRNKKKIAAIHSGWKGAYNGIAEKVVEKFIRGGSKIKNLKVVIGPCISQKSYEVKKDFLNKFKKKFKKSIIFFKIQKNKIKFDLSGFIKYRLKESGVRSIEILKEDTFIQEKKFFSCRRSLLNGQKDYGRNISIIMIN